MLRESNMEFNESYVRVMTLYICDGFAPSFPMLVLCTLRERIKYGVQSYVRVRTLYVYNAHHYRLHLKNLYLKYYF